MSATKKRLPHGTIPFERITDRTVRDTVMKLNENIVALQRQLDEVIRASSFSTVRSGQDVEGSDYIDVSNGTVGAKVPVDGSKGLVTTDTVQKIAGTKMFKGYQPIELDANGGAYTRLRFVNNDKILGYVGSYLPEVSTNLPWRKTKCSVVWGGGEKGDSQCLLVGTHDDYGPCVQILNNPNSETSNSTSTDLKVVSTMGWTNSKFLRIENLKAGENISITPDATGKALTISSARGLDYARKTEITFPSSGWNTFTASEDGAFIGVVSGLEPSQGVPKTVSIYILDDKENELVRFLDSSGFMFVPLCSGMKVRCPWWGDFQDKYFVPLKK